MKPVAASGVLRRALPFGSAEAASRADALRTAAPGDPAWAHFTRRHAVALLYMREHVPALRDLERGPWACLQAIAPHWQGGRRDAFPGQERLARLSGYDARSIREFTKQLEACGVLDVTRLKLPDGTARLHYEPGPAVLAGVEQFDARYSDERPKPVEVAPNGPARGGLRAKPLAPVDHARPHRQPPEVASGGGAAAISGELPDPRDQKSTSFCSAEEPEAGASNDEPGPKPSELDRDVAREVLGVLRERELRAPGRAVRHESRGHGRGVFERHRRRPRNQAAGPLGRDRACLRRLAQYADPKLRVGSIDHFLNHETQGRRARVKADQARARKARAAEAERLRARDLARQEREGCGPPLEVLQFIAEF